LESALEKIINVEQPFGRFVRSKLRKMNVLLLFPANLPKVAGYASVSFPLARAGLFTIEI